MADDVIVIGAGLAGLAAARALVAGGRSVRVLEARERVGVRTEGGVTADGTPVELGGQWLGDPRPFWREAGLNGQAASDVGPVKVVFDNSPPSGTPGILMGFFEGAEARRWMRRSAAERRRAAVDCFVRYFGPDAAEPLEYLERDWNAEEFTRGC